MARRLPSCVIIIALALTVLSGCAGYDRDSERRTLGQTTDDLAIQVIVKTRLFDEPDISGFAITTNVRRGVVTLYGRVTSVELRDRALEIAAGVRGVNRVVDRLVVVPSTDS
jgi:hyperosmotically inducible periplasmic protein